MQNAVQVTEEA